MIADICARLDGLPLAIELAAARTRAFPIAQIAARLNDRFRLLTGGSRTALPRQQTLRAVVDWSYELLFDDEQRVFERLSVFPGGCDLATAEAVCADETLAAADLADHLHALVDKSLVVAVPRGRRAAVHPAADARPVRPGAARPSGATPCASATRWPQHFARLCSQSAAAFTGDRQRAWLTAIDQEHDNLRAALDWAVANDDAETALMIAGGAALAALADRHGGRGPALARRRLRLRGRGGRAHPGAGADRPRPPRLPRRRARAQRRRPGDRARDLRAPRRRRVDGAGALVLRRAGRRPRRPRRGPPPPAGRPRLLRRVARRPVRGRGPVVLAGEAGDPGRRPRRGRAPLPSRHRGLRAARPAGHELDVPRHGRRLRRAGRRLPRRHQDARGRHRDQRVAARRLHRLAPGPPRMGAAPRRPAGAGRGGLPAGARLGPPGAAHHGDLPGPGRAGRRCTGSTGATTRPSRPPPRRWSSTGPAGSAGSGTASTPRPTCRPPPPCAARCSPPSPPSGTSRSGRRPCSGRPSACASDAGRRGPGVPARRRRAGPGVGDRGARLEALPRRVRARAARATRRPRAPEPGVQRQRGRQISALLDGAGVPALGGARSRRIP